MPHKFVINQRVEFRGSRQWHPGKVIARKGVGFLIRTRSGGEIIRRPDLVRRSLVPQSPLSSPKGPPPPAAPLQVIPPPDVLAGQTVLFRAGKYLVLGAVAAVEGRRAEVRTAAGHVLRRKVGNLTPVTESQAARIRARCFWEPITIREEPVWHGGGLRSPQKGHRALFRVGRGWALGVITGRHRDHYILRTRDGKQVIRSLPKLRRPVW